MNNRYKRNIKVIGEDGQHQLASSSVFIIGCGALGGQLAMLLAGAGIGKIGIADFDTVDLSNLQRQLFFEESQAGLSKASIIAERLRRLNSEVTVESHNELIHSSNADRILRPYDIIADATDNPATKYFVDKTALSLGKTCCIGGVAAWRGQVVLLSSGENGMRYKDIFPAPENDPAMLPCEIEGVMGPTASTVSSIQASEIINALIHPEGIRSKLISLDLSVPSFNVIHL